MRTGSFIINKLMAALAALNFYFEQSWLYRGVCGVKRATRGSVVLGRFLRGERRDYWGGSLICRGAGFVFGLGARAWRWVARAFAWMNASSWNRRAWLWVWGERSEVRGQRSEKSALGGGLPGSFVGRAVRGCVPWRVGAWFLEERTEDRGQRTEVRGQRTEVRGQRSEKAKGVAGYKVLYMLFLCGVLVVPGPFWNNGLILVSAVFFALLFIGRGDGARVYLSPALLLFVLFCGVSIFTGYGGADSLRVFVIFFACVVHSVCVARMVTGKAELRLLVKLVALALAVTAVVGFVQLAMGIPMRPEFTDLRASPGLARVYATFSNPNNAAQMWGMLLPFALAGIFMVRCDGKRLLLVGAAGLTAAAFMLTYSRAGYVALVAALGIFVLMRAPRLVPMALVALVAAVPLIPTGVIERLLTLGTDTSSLYRFDLWRGVLSMLEVYWVQGIGMGPAAFTQVYPQHYYGAAWWAVHAHNTFLDIFVHSGIGALAAFAAYLFSLVRRGVAAHSASGDGEYKLFAAAAVASLGFFILFGLGEYVWFYPRVMLVFWVVAGLLTAVVSMQENAQADDTEAVQATAGTRT